MKNVPQSLKKVFWIAVAALSLVCLLTGPMTFKSEDTQKFVTEMIDKFADEDDDTALAIVARATVAAGLKDELVKQVPDTLKVSGSYISLYHFVSKYKNRQEVRAKDLQLHPKNRVQQFLTYLILYLINTEFQVHHDDIEQIFVIYQLSVWMVVILYLLGAVLIIFRRRLAWLPILLGGGAAFGCQIFMTQYMTNLAQREVYSKIFFSYSWPSVVGFALAVLLSCYMAAGDWKVTQEKKQQKAANKQPKQEK